MYTGNVNQNEVRPLFLISLDIIATNPSVLTAEQLLHCPDELCIVIFNRILEMGKLNPQVLEAFLDSSEAVALQIKQMGISSWIPPLIMEDKDKKRWW